MGAIAFYVTILAVSVFLYIDTASFAGFRFGHTGPATFPRIILLFLGAICLMALAQVWLKRNAARQFKSEVITKGQIIFFMIVLIYLAAIPIIHFFPATMAFLLVVVWYLNPNAGRIKKELPKMVIATGLTAAAIWYIFAEKLDVFFP